MNLIEWIIIGALVVVGLAVTLVILSFFTTWLKALLAKAPVGFPTLLAMRLRGVPVGLIVDARVTAVKASLPLTTDQLEAHYLAEGNVVQTVQALIAASKANIELSWDRLAPSIWLPGNKQVGFGGRSHLHQSEDHRLHDRRKRNHRWRGQGRDSSQGTGSGHRSKQFGPLRRKRSGRNRHCRVGESIVSTIGSSENYKVVLENPNSITEKVLDRGLDQGTAFEILSIDIADVDLGENAEPPCVLPSAADKEVAQAQAEIRRAAAVALEQENKAKVEEMQAKLVEAEARFRWPWRKRSATETWASWITTRCERRSRYGDAIKHFEGQGLISPFLPEPEPTHARPASGYLGDHRVGPGLPDRKNISEKARPRKRLCQSPDKSTVRLRPTLDEVLKKAFGNRISWKNSSTKSLLPLISQANGATGRARSSSALFARANTDFFFAGNARGTNTCTEPGRRARRNFCGGRFSSQGIRAEGNSR